MAGFGFNTTNNIAMDFAAGNLNMDFSFDQSAEQQSFPKADEGNTSSNAFFFAGDEGIDTSLSQFDLSASFSTPSVEASFAMPMNLMDNTLNASTAWDSHLSPSLNPFSMTPNQSFTSMDPYQSVNTMGKRPLQLDAHDFPQSKRHESLTSTSFTPFATSPSASMSGSTWVESQATPASSVDVVGLSDEAADVCALWFSKYAILPSDRHIDSLSQLTGEPAGAIRQWFGQLLKQGMTTHGDSAYKSQTNFIQQEQPLANNTLQYTTSELPCSNETTSSNQPAARGGKKGCTPTKNVDLLRHDPTKIYQCTRKCGKRYTRKCDWKRNEEEWYPSKSWLCSLCVTQGTNDKLRPCFRRYHFSQHFRNLHPGLNSNDYEASSLVESDTGFPRRCGFCPHRFSSRQDRIDHIAEHFKKGKSMLEWVDHDDDSNSDNNDDDDDDDKPDDGFSDNSGSKGPGSGSSGSRRSRHNRGGNGDSGGGSDSGSFSGFGQFQLATCQGDISPDQPPVPTSLRPYGPEDVTTKEIYTATGSGQPCDNSFITCGSMAGSEIDIQRQTQRQKSRINEATQSDTTSVAGNAFSGAMIRKSAEHDQLESLCSIFAQDQGISDKLSVGLDQPTRSLKTSLSITDGIDESPNSSRNSGSRLSESFERDVSPVAKQTSMGSGSESERPVAESVSNEILLNTGGLWARPTPPPSPPVPDDFELSSLAQSSLVSAERSTAPAEIVSSEQPSTLQVSLSENGNSARQQSPVPSTLDWREINGPTTELLSNSQSFLSVKLLGTGGFSTVDEVIHRETNLRVSRKTLKNREISAVEELKKEVAVLKKLRHPHIIRFLGAYAKGDKVSILLSPVAETTLALWLQKNVIDKPTGLSSTIVQMLGCLSSTIRYLHEQRPVVKHMDIKPQNILVKFNDSEIPHVILSDFGISSSEELSPEGRTRAITRQYCAPEVPSGLVSDQAADIWSLGCVFSEMLAVAFFQKNAQWLDFLKEFHGRGAKSYYEDVPRLRRWLSGFQEQATSSVEADAVGTVKTMVNVDPALRPDASMLAMIFTPASCCLQWPNKEAAFPGPHEELETVEKLVQYDAERTGDEHGCSCSANDPVHGPASSETSFASAKLWLDECIHDHEACVWPRSDNQLLPARLIDIHPKQVDGLSSVRVVNSADINRDSKQIGYIAVSHVWSPSDLTLSTDNVNRIQTELPRQELSDAMNQAVSAAEELGYHYIWADSLCVLQDSVEDKRRECASMASNYRTAALTVVIDQSGSINTVHRSVRDNGANNAVESQNVIKEDTADNSVLKDAAASSGIIIDWTAPGFAWDTRAWGLQERLLSHRLLHLAGEQMYWECNSLKASETFPRGLPSLVWEKAHTTTNATKKSTGGQLHSTQATRLRDCQWIKKEGDGIGDSMSCQPQIVLQDHSQNEVKGGSNVTEAIIASDSTGAGALVASDRENVTFVPSTTRS